MSLPNPIRLKDGRLVQPTPETTHYQCDGCVGYCAQCAQPNRICAHELPGGCYAGGFIWQQVQEPPKAPPETITITWWTDDVLSVAPNLTNAEASEVLLLAKRTHDANVGINWDVLKCCADQLFPWRG